MSGSLETRNYTSKAEHGFVYKNTCLLRSLKIKKSRELRSIQVIINSVFIDPSSESSSHYIFDFKAIRDRCRETLGGTKEENDLMTLEDTLAYNQLHAMRHYLKTPVSELKNCVFTSSLQIAFCPKFYSSSKGQLLGSSIDVDEEFYKSDFNHNNGFGK
jgi:hypothetical protein